MANERTKRPKFAGLKLLGDSRASVPRSPNLAKVETFPNPYPGRDYHVHIQCPEFTSLCPVTGQPDFAEILIDYVPDRRCVETKSLKLYLSSYRNVHSFNEQIVNRILDDLVRVSRPRKMKIEGRFVPRGGLSLSVIAEHPSENGLIAHPRN